MCYWTRGGGGWSGKNCHYKNVGGNKKGKKTRNRVPERVGNRAGTVRTEERGQACPCKNSFEGGENVRWAVEYQNHLVLGREEAKTVDGQSTANAWAKWVLFNTAGQSGQEERGVRDPCRHLGKACHRAKGKKGEA